MVQNNRNERIESTENQLAQIRDEKQKVKSVLDGQLHEHHICLQYVIKNLKEMKKMGAAEADLN